MSSVTSNTVLGIKSRKLPASSSRGPWDRNKTPTTSKKSRAKPAASVTSRKKKARTAAAPVRETKTKTNFPLTCKTCHGTELVTQAARRSSAHVTGLLGPDPLKMRYTLQVRALWDFTRAQRAEAKRAEKDGKRKPPNHFVCSDCMGYPPQGDFIEEQELDNTKQAQRVLGERYGECVTVGNYPV